uniref:Uncharacterized protein n=1 Tax=Daphnia magna TaxID=35525 RepID=A0A0P4XRJ9_9CRUS
MCGGNVVCACQISGACAAATAWARVGVRGERRVRVADLGRHRRGQRRGRVSDLGRPRRKSFDPGLTRPPTASLDNLTPTASTLRANPYPKVRIQFADFPFPHSSIA